MLKVLSAFQLDIIEKSSTIHRFHCIAKLAIHVTKKFNKIRLEDVKIELPTSQENIFFLFL